MTPLRFRNDVVWVKEKPFCVSWNGWHPRNWVWGKYIMPYDGLIFWSFGLGLIQFHNDFYPADKENRR